MKIEDNFLKQEEFDKIQKLMGEPSPLPWFYADRIVFEDDVDKFQFIHAFYDNHMPMSPFTNELDSIINIIQPFSIVKIRAKLLTRTPEIVTIIPNSVKTAIMRHCFTNPSHSSKILISS